jgi:hypothetical protein
LKDKVNGLETNSKKYRRINEPDRGYPPRINPVKNENGHLITDSHDIFINCKITLNSY